MKPPTLLSLAIDSALLHIARITDLSAVPDPILVELFLKTLSAGKLTEKVLKLFIGTGSQEILLCVEALNIKQILAPVLPTSSVGKFLNGKMPFEINTNEVDIVIAAIRPDLTTFLEGWRAIFSKFHLIIIKDPELKAELQIPSGFDHRVYAKPDMERLIGSTSIRFSGHSCRYFGYLISSKKYIISIDDNCLPAKDSCGNPIDAVSQHIINLKTPATPFYFNTLYDPFRSGADFVRGYPFSLRNGVECVLSSGLWLNFADYDAPTRAAKPHERNSRYVDAVMSVPCGAMVPVSGINIGFNRDVLGPAMIPALHVGRSGTLMWETMEDIWCGMCAKLVCDHLGIGAKTGLPYVWRDGGLSSESNACESLKVEWKGEKLMEVIMPFFQSVKLPRTAITAENCVVQIASLMRERLGAVDPVFGIAADTMEEWVKLWRIIESQRN